MHRRFSLIALASASWAVKPPVPIGQFNVWELWKDKVSGNSLQTFTVITTDPNEQAEKMRNRMPVTDRAEVAKEHRALASDRIHSASGLD